MLLLEPARTPYDLHFPFFGVPTRIHPGFWLMAFILGFNSDANPLSVLIFTGVLFVSILVHEFGHALMMIRFGYEPHMVLYHMGGLAVRSEGFAGGFERPRRDTWSSILISLAGPGAGFLLAAAVVLLIALSGATFVSVDVPTVREPLFFWHYQLSTDNAALNELVYITLQINILWGLINLVPVFPLDGGQIARELLTHRDRSNGLVHTLQLSIGMGVVMALALWFVDQPYAAIMFALLAAQNYVSMQQLGRSW